MALPTPRGAARRRSSPGAPRVGEIALLNERAAPQKSRTMSRYSASARQMRTIVEERMLRSVAVGWLMLFPDWSSGRIRKTERELDDRRVALIARRAKLRKMASAVAR